MWKRMKVYASVYLRFLSTCFAAASTYRLHFVLLLIMDQLFYFTMLGSVDFIFDHVPRIGSWGRPEFMFFIAYMLAVDHLHMTFVSESFWEFAFDIRTGRLDFILLRPLNTLFTLFARQIRPGTLLNGVTPWTVLWYYGHQLQLASWSWICLPFLVVLSLFLLTALEILLSMLMFWTIESYGINFLRMQLQGISRWPDFVYQGWARRIFAWILPVLLVGTAPVRFLLDAGEYAGIVNMLLCLVLTCLAIAWAWRKALRAYESASS